MACVTDSIFPDLVRRRGWAMVSSTSSRDDYVAVGKSVGAGAIAGAASKTFVAPLERIRLLLQTANGGGSASNGLRAVLTKEGAVGLWRGNGLAVARATLQKGTLFATQDTLHKVCGNHAVAGAAAGLMAGTLTYPLDLIRTCAAPPHALLSSPGTPRGPTAPAAHPLAHPLFLAGGLLVLLPRQGNARQRCSWPATCGGSTARADSTVARPPRWSARSATRDCASASSDCCRHAHAHPPFAFGAACFGLSTVVCVTALA